MSTIIQHCLVHCSSSSTVRPSSRFRDYIYPQGDVSGRLPAGLLSMPSYVCLFTRAPGCVADSREHRLCCMTSYQSRYRAWEDRFNRSLTRIRPLRMSSAYMCIVAGVYRHPGYARLWPWIVRSVPHSYIRCRSPVCVIYIRDRARASGV